MGTENTAAISTNTKMISKIADNIRLTMDLVKDFKDSVSVKLDKNISALSHLGSSLSKSFSLSSLGNKIGDAFNKGLKSLTNPFKALGGKISSAFTGLKTKLAGFNPIAAVKNKVKNVISKPMTAVKTLFGKTDEQLKAKFFRVWSNPKKVAKIWNKEMNKVKAPVVPKKPSKVGGLLKSAGGIVKQFIVGLFDALGKFLPKLTAWFHVTLGPYLAPIAIGVLLLSLAIFAMRDYIKELIPVFGKVLSTVADIFDMVKGPVVSVLKGVMGVFTGMFDFVKNLWSALSGIASTVAGIFTFTSQLFDTINEGWTYVSDILLNLLRPIRDVVVALQPVFDGLVNLLKKFIDNPVGTAVDVGKSIVGGIKSIAGGIFGSDEETEGGSVLDSIFMKVGDALFELKEYIVGSGLKDNLIMAFDTVKTALSDFGTRIKEGIKSAFDYALLKINNMKVFASMKNYMETLIPEFHTELYRKMDALGMAINALEIKTGSSLVNTAKDVFNGISTAAAGLKNKIKGFFGFEVTEEDKKAAEGPKNPFEEFIKGFEQMRKDSIALLSDIKAAVVSIEKNKIEIGKTLSQNSGEVSDGKKTNNLQNITMNYQVDINQVTEKIDKTNEILQGILTNTAITDKGEYKASAVWSI
jgi:phage-related protein